MPAGANSKPDSLLPVDETTFGRRVIHSPLPVLALFGARSCPASRALRPLLRELALAHAGKIRFATMNAEQSGALGAQFGLQLTPTLLVVQGGEIVTRAVGFVAPELLRHLCEQIASGALPPDLFWSPVEATFEDLVVAPLLDSWGLGYVRQAPSPAPARGRIDFLVYDEIGAPPLTLFENKRQILTDQALVQATAQAHGYARALGIRSCVVAAPAGLWIYSSMESRPQLVRRITSLELHQQPADVPRILRGLHRVTS